MDSEMLTLIGVSNIVTFLRVLVYLVIIVKLMIWFDSKVGQPWSKNVEKIEAHPLSLAVWTSALWLGICFFFGMLCSG